MIKIQIKTGLKLIYLVINLVINRICTGFNLDLSIDVYKRQGISSDGDVQKSK